MEFGICLTESPFASQESTPAFNDESLAKGRVADTIGQLAAALATSSPSIDETVDVYSMQRIALCVRPGCHEYGRTEASVFSV